MAMLTRWPPGTGNGTEADAPGDLAGAELRELPAGSQPSRNCPASAARAIPAQAFVSRSLTSPLTSQRMMTRAAYAWIRRTVRHQPRCHLRVSASMLVWNDFQTLP